MIEGFGSAEDDKARSQPGAEQHADPGIKGEFGLAVLSAQPDVPEGPVEEHPEGKENGCRSYGQNQPAEVGQHEILNGGKEEAARLRSHDGKYQDDSKHCQRRPEKLVIDRTEQTEPMGT